MINDAISDCSAVLVVIGDQWLNITDSDGNRRLIAEEDFVRLENVGREGDVSHTDARNRFDPR